MSFLQQSNSNKSKYQMLSHKHDKPGQNTIGMLVKVDNGQPCFIKFVFVAKTVAPWSIAGPLKCKLLIQCAVEARTVVVVRAALFYVRALNYLS